MNMLICVTTKSHIPYNIVFLGDNVSKADKEIEDAANIGPLLASKYWFA